MRKIQKMQAECFMQTLTAVHKEMEQLIVENRHKEAKEILEECQQGAIELGNMIEQSESEGVSAVKLLEKYCELIYQVYESLPVYETTKADEQIHTACEEMQKLLCSITHGIKHDIKVHTEVVFLPYKASMWDSLESVWMAAQEDECCDAYVIPIPYYDKNPDGSFRELHYEGGQYPEYVPVTWYREYDFEERRPDIIFIHNPYDKYNYVTSVHPFYYSDNLKKYTDKLIYIPYFILNEINPYHKNEVEGMEHLCTTPGVFNADKVIVQSEAMRQIYINVLLAEGIRDRNYWEKKIAGTGSPKIDKVLNAKKEKWKIPRDWLNMIRRSDGGMKKVILYNTSISALLNHNEQMLAKMRDVFRIFYERKDEVALLWRPHPLIESTLYSMRPGLWEEYRKLRDEYIQENWGIYDDTADMDRAVALSDAYYGDWSSVVWLCRSVNMPVMLQNIEQTTGNRAAESINNERENNGISPLSGQFRIKDDMLYLLPRHYNGLFQADTGTGDIQFVSKFIYQENYKESLFTMDLTDEKLFFIPVCADEMAVYDLTSQSMHEILLEKEWGGVIVSSTHIFAEDYLWIFPACGNHILVFDYTNLRFHKNFDLRKIYSAKFGCDYEYFCANGSYYYDGSMYVACWEKPYLARLRIAENKVNFYHIPEFQKGFCAFNGNGQNLYALNDDGRLAVWNIQSRKLERIVSLEKEAGKQESKFYRKIYCVDKEVFIFPYGDISTALKVSLEDCVVSYISKKVLNQLEEESSQKEFILTDVDQEFLYGYTYGNQYFCVNLKTETIRWIRHITYDKRNLKDIIRNDHALLNQQKVINEGNVHGINDLIDIARTGVRDERNTADIGRKIYDALNK